MIPTWEPVNETACSPSCIMASDTSAIASRSPAVSSMSSSRRCGIGVISCAIFVSASVVPPIADTTTTTRFPAARVATTRRATRRIPLMSATELPPYFWTTRGMFGNRES